MASGPIWREFLRRSDSTVTVQGHLTIGSQSAENSQALLQYRSVPDQLSGVLWPKQVRVARVAEVLSDRSKAYDVTPRLAVQMLDNVRVRNRS